MRLLKLHPKITNDVKLLPAKHYKQIMDKCLDLLSNPKPNDSKLLRGYKDIYRITSGEYRIAYSFDDTQIEIYIVGLRNDDEVYKQLARRFH